MLCHFFHYVANRYIFRLVDNALVQISNRILNYLELLE
jgi:hypothetical protein